MGVNPYPSDVELGHYLTQYEIPRCYRLFPDLPVIDIFRYGAIIGATIDYYPVLERCMSTARQQIAGAEEQGSSYGSGTIIAAAQLAAGSGRFQRAWHAPVGGLWFSLVLVNTLSPDFSRLIPLVAALACHDTATSWAGVTTRLRWVNDVLVQGKKVAGILTEAFLGRHSQEEYILLGVGFNINNIHFPQELHGRATSLAQVIGQELSLSQAALDLLAKLRWYYGLLAYLDDLENGTPKPFMDVYRQACDSVGQRVRYGFDVEEHPLYEAKVTAITDDGSLCVDYQGHELKESGGEIRYLV